MSVTSPASWPSPLPQIVMRDGLGYVPVETRTVSSPETGEPMARARFTGDMTDLTASIQVSRAQHELFHDFWSVDLARGARPFLMADPLFGGDRVMLFMAPPKYVPISGAWRRIDMTLRILP